MVESRYGIWIPVYGNWGPLHHAEDPFDASYQRARSLLIRAEQAGFSTTLIAQHIINCYNQDFDQLETWTAAAALAQATEKIEIIAAIKPLLFHPAVLAKMALGIDAISQGRFSINLVSAWFRTEMEKAGIPFPHHDERYHYSEEWIKVVKALWSGERVNIQGDYFHISDLSFRPTPVARPYPRVYLGGESDPARNLAAQEADVFFINGQPIEEVRKIINDVSRRPRTLPEPLRFGMSAFIIARPTDEEAEAELDRLMLLQAANNDPYWANILAGNDPATVMFKTFEKFPHVGTNGGTAAGLVGSYDTVASRIADFAAIGIETFMLQFYPFTQELDRFSEEVMPRVKQLEPVA